MNHHVALIKKNPEKIFAGRYTVSVMLEHRGKLLLVQEAIGKIRGLWTPPSGHIDMNEDPFTAAIRECKEETGYKVKLTGLMCMYFVPAQKEKNGYINYTFTARPMGKPSPRIVDEIMATKWYSKSELKKLPNNLIRSERASECINDWLKGSRIIPLTFLRKVK